MLESHKVACLFLDGWMDGWIYGWTGGWMDGWMDGWTVGSLCIVAIQIAVYLKA